jgi:hypothetical protein
MGCRDDQAITIKHCSGCVVSLSGFFCAVIVTRDPVASWVKETFNSGTPAHNAWGLTWTKVVEQLIDALSHPSLTMGYWKAEEYGFFSHMLSNNC